MIELVLGALFLLGFKTRLVAFVLSGEMAAAYFISHFPRSFFPTENGGYSAAIFCFVFLYFVTAGAGRFSLDGVMKKR
ncbi:MAG TPA: DoxX family protein [Paenirhodobacter sp.]